MTEKIEKWRINAEEDYITTPISVLKYITILEEALTEKDAEIERLKNLVISLGGDFDDTLTQKEIDVEENYLEWDNETLGRCVRWVSKQLKETDITGYEGIKVMSSAFVLIESARKVNATTAKYTIEGHTYEGKLTGDWEVTIKKLGAK